MMEDQDQETRQPLREGFFAPFTNATWKEHIATSAVPLALLLFALVLAGAGIVFGMKMHWGFVIMLLGSGFAVGHALQTYLTLSYRRILLRYLDVHDQWQASTRNKDEDN